MSGIQRLFALLSILGMLATLSLAQDATKQNKRQTVAPGAASNPVAGSGTPGQISKWLGTDGLSFTIGDSGITEDKFGKVGIGTRTPTSPLTVRGMIEITLGGIKFPDGTTQTTSTAGALFGVAHAATLQGNGTLASPLDVAVPLGLSGSSVNPVLSVFNGGIGAGISSLSAAGDGVLGQSIDGSGVYGTSANGFGVDGFGGAIGVNGSSLSGIGVNGSSSMGAGVSGKGHPGIEGKGIEGGNNAGVIATGGNSESNRGGFGVVAFGGSSVTGNGGVGLLAIGGDSDGVAGEFRGDVSVSGTLDVTGTKNFMIDHPLDPENKYLYHAAIESSEVLNLYCGNAITNASGEAVITLPEWFEALNKDLRYQLTVIGAFAQAIVAEKVNHNRFMIRTSAPGVEVSWLVTGVRSDAVMLKHPFMAERDKPERERGHYLSPEAYGQPDEKGAGWARHPEMMQRLKQQRLEAEKKIKKQQ
jgi:hypothetical protein